MPARRRKCPRFSPRILLCILLLPLCCSAKLYGPRRHRQAFTIQFQDQSEIWHAYSRIYWGTLASLGVVFTGMMMLYDQRRREEESTPRRELWELLLNAASFLQTGRWEPSTLSKSTMNLIGLATCFCVALLLGYMHGGEQIFPLWIEEKINEPKKVSDSLQLPPNIAVIQTFPIRDTEKEEAKMVPPEHQALPNVEEQLTDNNNIPTKIFATVEDQPESNKKPEENEESMEKEDHHQLKGQEEDMSPTETLKPLSMADKTFKRVLLKMVEEFPYCSVIILCFMPLTLFILSMNHIQHRGSQNGICGGTQITKKRRTKDLLSSCQHK